MLPLGHDKRKIHRGRFYRPTEPDTPGFGGLYPLKLPFFDVFPLVLGHKGQYLENEICDKGPHEVLALACIQKRHIYDANIDAYLLCQVPPLLLYLLIIAAEPVYAEDIKQVLGPQSFYHPLVLRAKEIFSALLIYVKVLFRHTGLCHGYALAVFILVCAGNTNISKYTVFDGKHLFFAKNNTKRSRSSCV